MAKDLVNLLGIDIEIWRRSGGAGVWRLGF
jgi:hypothetical protein